MKNWSGYRRSKWANQTKIYILEKLKVIQTNQVFFYYFVSKIRQDVFIIGISLFTIIT